MWEGVRRRRSTARPEQSPRLDRGKVRRQYGIDKGRRVKCCWGRRKKEAFVQYASSNNPEDADETDLGGEKTEREIGGKRRYRIARDTDSKHH